MNRRSRSTRGHGPTLARTSCAPAALATALVLAATVPSSARQEGQRRPEYRAEVVAPQHEAFGFRIGEQRRYTRGPLSAFKGGEFEIWTLRLDDVDNAHSGMPLYTFVYGREMSLMNPGTGRPESLRASMSMTLNHYGFPVDIRYGGGPLEESDTDFVNKNGRLRWLGSAYLFRAPEGADERSFNFVLPSHEELNAAIPAGVFLSESENPALITIPAAIFQALGVTEMEYLSLRPNRIGHQQARRQPRRGDRSDRRTDVVRGKLDFKEVEEIEVGDRTYEAIKLKSSDTDEDLWIRSDGTLLRIDTDFRAFRNTYIRLLHPSEY